MSMSLPFTELHIEDYPRRVRVLFAGVYIVDTKKAKLVILSNLPSINIRWEHPYYPTLFFPKSELPDKYLREQQTKKFSGSSTTVYDVVVGSRRAALAVTSYFDQELAGLLKITFGAMDAWFEEEEQIFVHAKDPYKRVDVLQSSRHVRVEVNGQEIANTHKPRLLFETGLQVRTYIPKTDCRLDLFEPSELTTQCPYKGEANYYHVRLLSGEQIEDIIWWYRNPSPECVAIKGYVAFYDEKVDIWVDGEKQLWNEKGPGKM